MLKKLIELYGLLPIVRELRHVRESLWAIQNNQEAGRMLQLLDFVLPNHPRYGDPVRLHRYQAQVCSQNGEDGMLREIFRRIGTTNRIFAEVGIGDGNQNNTAFLLAQGWTGFWIEGNDRFVANIAHREDLKDSLKYLVSFATRENIASLFQQLGVPNEPDLISLDIDQNTYYLWEALHTYRPRVVIVEYNAALPPDLDWKVNYRADRTWDGTQNYGASLKAYELLGRQRGYSLVGCDFIGVNAFFVRDDLVADKFAAPFTAENHYEPSRTTMLHRRGHLPGILDRPPGK
jgi:hypothetical protein